MAYPSIPARPGPEEEWTAVGDAWGDALAQAQADQAAIRAELTAAKAEVGGAGGDRATLANPSFTGTVSGITKATVGLAQVDNTADAAKTLTGAQIAAGTLDAARFPAGVAAIRARVPGGESNPSTTNWAPRPVGFPLVINVGAPPGPADAFAGDLHVPTAAAADTTVLQPIMLSDGSTIPLWPGSAGFDGAQLIGSITTQVTGQATYDAYTARLPAAQFLAGYRQIAANVCSILYTGMAQVPYRHPTLTLLFTADSTVLARCWRADSKIEYGAQSAGAAVTASYTTHECVHLFQHSPTNGTSVTSGLIEGIADWVLIVMGYHGAADRRPADGGSSWYAGYDTTGFFLDYIERVAGGGTPGFVRALNQSLNVPTWNQTVITTLNVQGKTVEQLWSDYLTWVRDLNGTTAVTTDASGISATWTDVANNGTAPVVTGGNTFVTGASAGGNFWRSELILRSAAQIGAPKPDYIQLSRGDRVDVECDLHTSGFSALPSDASTTLFQVHGPTVAGAWYGPPLTLSIRAGTLRFGGGYNVPAADGTSRTDLGATWSPYSTGTDGLWRRVKISALIDGPGVGWASLWIDGALVVDRWKPPAGTWYVVPSAPNHSHSYVYLKVGCYGYSNAATAAAPLQVQHRSVAVNRTRAGATTIYLPPAATTASTLPFTDRENVTFTGAGQTSRYHTYAAGMAAGAGLLIWLHGDGAYEFNNPSSTYVMGGGSGVRAVAKQRGWIVVSALSPDTSGSITWWESGGTRADYVAALLDHLTAGYGVDKTRVVLAGYSGGAQQITQFFMAEHHEKLAAATRGGTIVFGGGEAPDVTPTYSTALKTGLPMHWAVGENDTAANASDGFDGRGAAEYGEAWFRGKGFTRTSIQIIPGKAHAIDGMFGGIVAARLDAAGGGGGTTTGTAADAGWKEVALRVVSTAENSTTYWPGAYGYIEDIGDGRGLTAGIVGWCSGTGDMLALLQYAQQIAPGNLLAKWIDELQTIMAAAYAQRPALSQSMLGSAFVADWKSAAQQPWFQQAQRDERDRVYWSPAKAQQVKDGVGNLGLTILYDISVNHGPGSDAESFGGICAAAAAQAKPPSQGGTEKAYLLALCDKRDAVLRSWGDYQPNGRSGALRTLVNNQLAFTFPITWSMYGSSYSIASLPTGPG